MGMKFITNSTIHHLFTVPCPFQWPYVNKDIISFLPSFDVETTVMGGAGLISVECLSDSIEVYYYCMEQSGNTKNEKVTRGFEGEG